VITVVLALAFFFEYAFENYWITEPARVGLGVLAGAAALISGERFCRAGHRAFGHSLTAAGIGFFYLSFWAAFGLYHLIGQTAAFALMLLVTLSAGALALRYGAASVAALGLAGGYATPLLLAGAQGPWFVLAYSLVLSSAAVWMTRRGTGRAWPWLEMLALAGSAMLYLNQFPMRAGMELLFAAFVLATAGLLGAAAGRPLGPPVFAASQVLATAALAAIWPGTSSAGIWLALLSAALGLALARRADRRAAALAPFGGFALGYGIWRWSAGTALSAALVPLALAFLLFLAWPLDRAIRRGRPLGLPDLLLMAFNAAFYFTAGYFLLAPHYNGWEGIFALSAAVAEMGAAGALWERERRGALFAAGSAWVLLVLAAPLQFAGFRITVAWAAEGAALAWIGARLADRRVTGGSLAILALVAGRLALVDAWTSPPVILWNARFVAFAAAAAACGGGAWWTSAMPAMKRFAFAAYALGHAALLAGLCLEAATWAGRNAAPLNRASMVSTSVSVVAAAYAVLLVAAGAEAPLGRHSAATRLLGVSLIALVVLKLYLYDVWLLRALYRMAAFAILGGLLLAMSYLYSRFRGSIEDWWRG
jgi:hypothetical protein